MTLHNPVTPLAPSTFSIVVLGNSSSLDALLYDSLSPFFTPLHYQISTTNTMSSEVDFNKAVEDVKNLENTPNDEELLEIYALYKQATVGDCNTTKPGLFDFKGKAKWEAWNTKKGESPEKAKDEYVAKVKSLIASYGLKQ